MQEYLLDPCTWQLRAAVYELLSLSFRYPDQTLVDALASGEYAEALAELTEAFGFEFPRELYAELTAYKGADAQTLLHVLRAEATRLFIGAPCPVVSPYEGVWRAADDGVQALLFLNPHTMAVERFMKACGLDQAEGKNEPLDHMATELEFLMYLSLLEAGTVEAPEGVEVPEGGWASMHDRFLEEHASPWIPCFAENVATETRDPFYRAAAGLLSKVV